MNMRDETLAIRTRLERVALTADIASHYIQDMRVMPAEGVARVAWDAMDHIEQMEKAMREKSFSEVAALGQASDAHDAQKAAEAKLARAIAALEQSRDELDQYSAHEYPGDHPVQARYRKRDYDANPARIALVELGIAE